MMFWITTLAVCRLRVISGVIFLFLVTNSFSQELKYAGYWHNTTFGSVGPMDSRIAVMGGQTQVSVNVSGRVFGSSQSFPAIDLVVPMGVDGVANFQLNNHPRFGDLTGQYSPPALEVNMTNIPGPGVDSMSMTGMIKPEEFTLSYRIQFTSGLPIEDQIEGVDFALGWVVSRPSVSSPFEWISPTPGGDNYSSIAVGTEGTAVLGSSEIVRYAGGILEKAELPANVVPRQFLGLAFNGGTFVGFDDSGQVYRSEDGHVWMEAGMLPDSKEYRDVAAGAQAGRFVFVGDDGVVDEILPGSGGERLAPDLTWTVPGEPDLRRVKNLGTAIFIGGEDGTIVTWSGVPATAIVESVSPGETVTDIALGGDLLVATTQKDIEGRGTVWRRSAMGGAWSDAGLGEDYNFVAYQPVSSRFLFAGTRNRLGLFDHSLTMVGNPFFNNTKVSHIAAVGDNFLMIGGSGRVSSVSTDGLISDLRGEVIAWPMYDMTRVGGRLLILSRFGRFYESLDGGSAFSEKRAFSQGFTPPSLRAGLTLNDGRLMVFSDEASGSAISSDAVSWQTYSPITNPGGGIITPRIRKAAIDPDGLILTIGGRRFGETACYTTTPENPSVMTRLSFFSSFYEDIVYAADHFHIFGRSIMRSDDGATWEAVHTLPSGSFATGYFDVNGQFALAGTSDGRLFRATPGYTSWVEVLSPFTSGIVAFCEAGNGGVIALSRTGEIALSLGADFEVVANHQGSFLNLHYDEMSRSVFALGEDGVILRLKIAEPVSHANWEAWQSTHFSAAQFADSSISGALADPDEDGNSNLLEFVFAGDPLLRELPFEVQMTLQGAAGLSTGFEAMVSPDALGALSIQMESSSDLLSWDTLGLPSQTLAGDRVKLIFPFSGNPIGTQNFGRLRVGFSGGEESHPLAEILR